MIFCRRSCLEVAKLAKEHCQLVHLVKGKSDSWGIGTSVLLKEGVFDRIKVIEEQLKTYKVNINEL